MRYSRPPVAALIPGYGRIHDALARLARSKGITTYSEIASLAGLNMGKTHDRKRIGEMLGSISSYEHRHGRPMLSALVVHQADDTPGPGFFDLARDLGLCPGYGEETERRFLRAEIQRVWDAWADAESASGCRPARP